VDFTSYTATPVKIAVNLVNTYQSANERDNLTSLDELQAFIEEYIEQPLTTINEADLTEIRLLRATLRTVFETTGEIEAARLLNQLLERYSATPRISWHGGPLHLHFEAIEKGLLRWLGAITTMGLTVVLCEYGKERLGLCASKSCQKAFVDISKNRRKIYCSESCAHRESMAAYRERRRSQT
jgi:predicted RNA-binding Zn ribbon-like protein